MRLVKSDYDPVTGMTEEFWYEEGIGDRPGKITMRRLQDVEDQLDFNRQCFNNHGNIGYGDSLGGAHHVARIPFSIIEKWKREGIIDWFNSTDAQRRKVLNDPDNKFLKVRPGKL